MPIPVTFEATAEDDLFEHASAVDLDLLVDEIDQRLGHFPLSGRRMDPPDGFARTVRLRGFRVYYEVIVNEEADEIDRVSVLRIIPDRLLGLAALNLRPTGPEG